MKKLIITAVVSMGVLFAAYVAGGIVLTLIDMAGFATYSTGNFIIWKNHWDWIPDLVDMLVLVGWILGTVAAGRRIWKTSSENNLAVMTEN